HDHPFDPEISQRDFWGVAAFFSRTARGNDMDMATLVERRQGTVRMPAPPGQQGQEMLPRFLTGEFVDPGPGKHLRRELGRLVTERRNPDFVRATVNRVWTFFFGEGFVDPDEITGFDLPMPEVLYRLERDFRASGYDMKRLCQVILNTRVYQLSSRGPEAGKYEQLATFARARLRVLNPEQLWSSIVVATGLDKPMAGEEAQYAQQRAMMLQRVFLRAFAQGDDELEQNSIPQALLLINGPITNDVLVPQNPVIAGILNQDSYDEQLMALFLRVLGRPASRAERQSLALPDASTFEQAQFIQDVAWALINSSEFSYNH
ncbi:DUF1549 and DUF1553 domain-containing protein, partial [Planctomycetota bacterium]|nr:DUF1549 and DUF1553 domain-containing protein [Planctomycetota bacterium]